MQGNKQTVSMESRGQLWQLFRFSKHYTQIFPELPKTLLSRFGLATVG